MNFIKRLFRPKQPDLLSVPTVSDTQSRPKAAPSDSGVASDSPILSPNQDVFGIDPFAMTLAGSIAKVDVKDGVVFAINGAWGSGKSSAVNLVVHHLGDEFKDKDIVVVTFNPWWFSVLRDRCCEGATQVPVGTLDHSVQDVMCLRCTNRYTTAYFRHWSPMPLFALGTTAAVAVSAYYALRWLTHGF
jgi:hypothetical protein